MKPQQLSYLIVLLTVGALVTAFLIKPKFGLDIQGGARVVLEADTAKLPAGRAWDRATREAVVRTIDNRVNANGVAEPVITTKGERQFVVEIPAIRNEREVLEQLQTTAQLQFYYSNNWVTNRNNLGQYEIGRAADAGNRELYQITDRTSGQTFRDLYQINNDLRALLDRGAAAGDKAKETPLPAPLPDLSAAAGKTSARVAEEDVAKVTGLATEADNFNKFLNAARKEMDGSDVLPTARSGFDQAGRGGAVIELEFNRDGKEKFARFTRDHTNEILMIYLDGRILTAPNINEPILNGRAQISGFATIKEAKGIADLLNGGALPVPLKIVQQQSVEATLGKDAVRQSLIAGLVGVGAVIAFVAGYYLLPGMVACVALLLYTLFTYAAFLLFNVTFTLPGIAGFILSVGMAVDANILIFERTKEELRAGRPLRQSIETGFHRAFSAIFDSNMCTAVTSLLLYFFGTGTVRGFALTLLIGVAISMFTAITVTRTLLLLLVGDGRARDLKSWGIHRQLRPNLQVVPRRFMWYGISALIIVPGVAFAVMGGFKPGIDFTGGSELTLRFAQNVPTRSQIERAVTAAGVKDPAAQIAGENTVFVRLPKQEGRGEVTAAEADRIVAQLQTSFPGVTREGFESIGGSISTELTRNALLSIAYASAFIVIYLAFRFAVGGFTTGLKYGVAAILAMLHDVGVLVGLFCALGYLLNWKVDSMFITAALTVIGFSVHDTIIIFDRIRENLQVHRGEDLATTIDGSINETLARSLFTSLTVIITLVALLILGGPVIRPLNAALLIGIVSGTFSSIFNAAPLVYDFRKWFATGKPATAPRAAGSGPSRGDESRPSTPSKASLADRPSSSSGPIVPARPATPAPSSTSVTENGSGTAEARPKPGIPQGPRARRRRM
ncbi:MAG: protein translocase subunit SecD [Capsulimonadales bacterium]|nr:protein translocase subunit SecD [Capsulimonadales bacterium]